MKDDEIKELIENSTYLSDILDIYEEDIYEKDNGVYYKNNYKMRKYKKMEELKKNNFFGYLSEKINEPEKEMPDYYQYIPDIFSKLYTVDRQQISPKEKDLFKKQSPLEVFKLVINFLEKE